MVKLVRHGSGIVVVWKHFLTQYGATLYGIFVGYYNQTLVAL